MYAETFNVQPKWEEAAKWLRWAMQGLTHSRSIREIRYNLRQFWKALEAMKRQAASPQDWGDLLTLDGGSQWTLAKLHGHELDEVQSALKQYTASKNLNAKLGWITVVGLPELARRLLKIPDPSLRAFGKRIEDLSRQAEAAARTGQELAKRAEAAYQQTRVTGHQAGNLTRIAGNAVSLAQNEARSARRTLDSSRREDAAVPSPLSLLPSFEIPWWVWAAGGAVLLLALTASQAPRVIALGAARRAMA